MSPRHFHKMMSPQFFNNPESAQHRYSVEQEKKIENFFKKLRAKISLKKHFPKI